MGRKYEIVDALARGRVVERMVRRIVGRQLDDLEDLAQMVYVILLEYDEDKIIDLEEHNQMRFFIARVIMNQYRSTSSPFYYIFRKHFDTHERIGRRDFPDEWEP